MAKTMKEKPRRLGRGLSSLIGEPVRVDDPAATPAGGGRATTEGARVERTPESQSASQDQLVRLKVADIEAGTHQPRTEFDEASLSELAASIKQTGVMQPVLVRANSGGNRESGAKWELIAGERRWRAAAIAGLTSLPAIIMELSDVEAAQWSIVENVQRQDLNAIERALAFGRLINEFGMTQGEVARKVGLDRSTIANIVRLADLEAELQELIVQGRLSPGHGKALLGVEDAGERLRLGREAAKRGWSVRKLEAQTRMLAREHGAQSGTDDPAVGRRLAAQQDLERRLEEKLGTRVRVRADKSGTRGSITLAFYDLDQLDGLLEKLDVNTSS